jgi:hypothetical protein
MNPRLRNLSCILAVLGASLLVAACSTGSNGGTNGGTSGGSSGGMPSPGPACSGWAQTSDCVASGPREAQNDKPCDQDLDPGWSGYCECGGGHVGLDCGHVVISCDDACQIASERPGSCLRWKQTSYCLSTGPREPFNDKDCLTFLDPGWSGYCECGQKVVELNCGHPSLTCAEACAE